MTKRCSGWLWVLAVVAVCGVWIVSTAAQKPAAPAGQKPASADVVLGEALHLEQNEGRLEEAIGAYRKALAAPDATRAQKARAQFRIGECYARLGAAQTVEARKAYEAVVTQYGDQGAFAALARARLRAAGDLGGTVPATPASHRLWTNPGFLFSAVSPDGKLVAYSNLKDDTLVLRDVTTGAIRQLTAQSPSSNDVVGNAAWSMDQTQLAFLFFSNDGSEARIVEVASGKVRPIAESRSLEPCSIGDWSADGKVISIGLSGLKQPSGIALLHVNGGPAQIIGTPGDHCVTPHFSQDGRFLAYTGYHDGDQTDRDVKLVRADGGAAPLALLAEPSDDRLVNWTPDGQYVLFMSNRSGREALWRLAVADGRRAGNPELVRDGFAAASVVGLSRTGALYYTTGSTSTDVFLVDVDLQAARFTGEPVRITYGATANQLPTYSPDGGTLAYFSRVTSRQDDQLVLAEGAKRVVRRFAVPFRTIPTGLTAWSADGQLTALASDASGQVTLMDIDVQTGGYKPIGQPIPPSRPDADAAWPVAISQDGRVMIKRVGYRADGSIVLIRSDLATGQEKEVYRHEGPGGIIPASISPDGKTVAFQLNLSDRRLMAVSMDGGPESTLWSGSRSRSSAFAMVWTPDGQGLLVPHDSETATGRAEIWLCPVAGGAPRRLTGLTMASIFAMALRPDGRQLAISGALEGAATEFWILENFLSPAEAKPKTH